MSMETDDDLPTKLLAALSLTTQLLSDEYLAAIPNEAIRHVAFAHSSNLARMALSAATPLNATIMSDAACRISVAASLEIGKPPFAAPHGNKKFKEIFAALTLEWHDKVF